MRTVSVINLKGGVGKTTTAQNLAYGLWKYYQKRVLVVDNDKQGNISKAFGGYTQDSDVTVAALMTERHVTESVIHQTQYTGIDIIPANMGLLDANLKVMRDVSRPQQNRFEAAFQELTLDEKYDFVIIDNAPDINISIINAFTVSDDVIIPVQMDEYSFDGIDILLEQISNNQEYFNDRLSLAGCLCTFFQKDDVNMQAMKTLRESGLPVFDTVIRLTNSRPREAVFAKKPLLEYSIRCGASQDYKHFVQEYVTQIG